MHLVITAFVLKYRLPDDCTMKNKCFDPLQDAQRAIRQVREHTSYRTKPFLLRIVYCFIRHCFVMMFLLPCISLILEGMAFRKNPRKVIGLTMQQTGCGLKAGSNNNK